MNRHEITDEKIPEEKSLLGIRFKNLNTTQGKSVPYWSGTMLGSVPPKSRSHRKQNHFNKQVLFPSELG